MSGPRGCGRRRRGSLPHRAPRGPRRRGRRWRAADALKVVVQGHAGGLIVAAAPRGDGLHEPAVRAAARVGRGGAGVVAGGCVVRRRRLGGGGGRRRGRGDARGARWRTRRFVVVTRGVAARQTRAGARGVGRRRAGGAASARGRHREDPPRGARGSRQPEAAGGDCEASSAAKWQDGARRGRATWRAPSGRRAEM